MGEPELKPVVMPAHAPVYSQERMVMPFSRFDLGDLEKWGAFLLKRLGESYPFIRETQHAGWIRSLINMPDTMFIKTAQVVGCAQIQRDIFKPDGWVQERFVFSRSKSAADQVTLIYQEIWRWACNVGVHEFVVDKLTDASRDLIQEALKTRILKREEFYLKL
jgi:hypothetical protein